MASGFINFHKPIGITSMDSIALLKSIFKFSAKMGHCGTLDPIAEGVLPLAIGSATRLMEYVVDSEKRYSFRVKLGESTTTYDSEGEIIKSKSIPSLNENELKKIIDEFIGNVEQIPPMYSALRFEGKRLYEIARSGIQIQRTPRLVQVNSISINMIQLPFIDFSISCGKGFYVRSFANDLGEKLKCGAHLVNLKRTKTGVFTIEKSLTIGDIKNLTQKELNSFINSLDYPLSMIDRIDINKFQAKEFIMGKNLNIDETLIENDSEIIRVYSEDVGFLGIGLFDRNLKILKPKKVFQKIENL